MYSISGAQTIMYNHFLLTNDVDAHKLLTWESFPSLSSIPCDVKQHYSHIERFFMVYVQCQLSVPIQKALFTLYSESESKSEETGVVNGHVACPTFKTTVWVCATDLQLTVTALFSC